MFCEDVSTAQRLELVQGAAKGAGSISLLNTLNLCRTMGGSRLLRATLLQPPCLLEDIERRLLCVEELVDTPIFYHDLQVIFYFYCRPSIIYILIQKEYRFMKKWCYGYKDI
jgi:DNA mismatch repair ATPase MutS